MSPASLPEAPAGCVLDVAFWGIPILDPNMQAERIEPPARKWGTIARTAHHPGTYHFYAWDFAFTGLVRDPLALVRSGCKVAVEANFTLEDDTPRALAIERIYQKRRLARIWQEHGVRIVVDLNVPANGLELLGVPAGWRAYATRKHKCMPLATIWDDHERAVRHAGTRDILFCVYGGGRAVRDICRRHALTWIPEHAQVVRGIEPDDGTRRPSCSEGPARGQVRVGHGRA